MHRYSRSSLARLKTCHEDLQQIFGEVLPIMDHSIVCGRRGMREQNAAFEKGQSRKRWPHSKHNSYPSMAVDVAPWKPGVGIDWNDIWLFKLLARVVLYVAERHGIALRWGGDWDNDPMTTQDLYDYGHFELVGGDDETA